MLDRIRNTVRNKQKKPRKNKLICNTKIISRLNQYVLNEKNTTEMTKKSKSKNVILRKLNKFYFALTFCVNPIPID